MIDAEALRVLKWGVMCETENDSETKRPEEDKHEETNIKRDRKDLFLCDCTSADESTSQSILRTF